METVPHPNASSNPRSSVPDLREAIRRRAEEIYVRNGRIPGREVENWVQAEKEILREATGHSYRPPSSSKSMALVT
jgi:hypothetical protein